MKLIGLLFGVVAWAQPLYTVQTVAGNQRRPAEPGCHGDRFERQHLRL